MILHLTYYGFMWSLHGFAAAEVRQTSDDLFTSYLDKKKKRHLKVFAVINLLLF